MRRFKELTDLCNIFSLADVFRKLNPCKYATTWHAPDTKDIHTRLDRFYISKQLVNKNIEFNFYPISSSDHDIFSFTLKNSNTCNFGPSYWKVNDSLLEDESFVNSFRLFFTYHTKGLEINLSAWDSLKEKIKNFCILLSKKKSKENFDFARKLRKEYSVLMQRERDTPGQYFEQIETLRKQIKVIHEQSYFGSRVRAKVETLENEENPSNYFNKTEKRKSNKKTITKIESENITYTTSKDILSCFHKFYTDLYSSESIDETVAD